MPQKQPQLPEKEYDAEKMMEVYKAARMYMNKHYPFFGHLIDKLNPRFTESVPTLATDGNGIMINKDYFGMLHDEDKMLPVAAIIHELYHCVMDFEIGRSENVPQDEHQYWNMAEDYHINGWLDENGFPVHQDWLLDPQYFRNDLTVEALVEILKQESDGEDGHCGRCVEQAEAGNGNGSGTQNPFSEGDIVEASVKEKEQGNSRNWGNVPGGIERIVEEIVNPPLNWDNILKRYMVKADMADWTDYHRINRRNLSGTIDDRIRLPVDNGERAKVHVYIDTSGSIRDTEMAECIALISNLCRQKNAEIQITWWDTMLYHDEETYTSVSWDELEPRGGGGTDVQPAIEHHNEEEPLVSICFTDGYFSEPNDVPNNMMFILYEGGNEQNLEAVTDNVFRIENRSQ